VQKGEAVTFCSPEEKATLSEIEKYLSKPITVLDIAKKDYAETLNLTEDVTDKWKDVMREIEEAEKWRKGKKK
jgi:ATP-dependent RNA helicase RhlE